MNKELLDEIETALSDTRQYAWSFARYNADKRAAGVCEDADAVLAKLREARNADGATILSNADKRPQRLLWAPGNYLCRCGVCDKQFVGDKRAVLCADCAYAAPAPAMSAETTAINRESEVMQHSGDELRSRHASPTEPHNATPRSCEAGAVMSAETMRENAVSAMNARKAAEQIMRDNCRRAGDAEMADAIRALHIPDSAPAMSAEAGAFEAEQLMDAANYFAKLMSKADLSVWEHLMNYVRRHALELRSLPLTAPKEDGR